ncbi:MAG: tetratricopeptide repeat protein [Chromatiales bacterium]|nr:tetratricopeptide repeat protein [Chromatiales bacterium]
MPCDEQLFDRVLTQWQFGDWNRLAGLDPDAFAHHPRRARLALLAAAGHQQLGRLEEARRLVRLAHEWGCDRTLIERVLISGVYNTLGRANALAGRQGRARERLETALAVGAPGQDLGLLMPVRIRHQFDDTGLPVPAITTPRALVGHAPDSKADQATLEAARAAWMLGDWQALTTFDKADLVQHPVRAELAAGLIAAGYQQLGDMAAADRCTQLALVWGEDRRRMRATLTSECLQSARACLCRVFTPWCGSGQLRARLADHAGPRRCQPQPAQGAYRKSGRDDSRSRCRRDRRRHPQCRAGDRRRHP